MKLPKLLTAIFLCLLVGSTLADIIKVPTKKPAITVNIPDSWEPEETDRGVACESPDKIATVFFEVVASEKGMTALIDENIDWLVSDQGVKITAASKKETDILVGGMQSSLIGFDANSKEFGPAKVGFIFTAIGKKLLVTTYWLTKSGFEKQQAALDKILASVKPVN